MAGYFPQVGTASLHVSLGGLMLVTGMEFAGLFSGCSRS